MAWPTSVRKGHLGHQALAVSPCRDVAGLLYHLRVPRCNETSPSRHRHSYSRVGRGAGGAEREGPVVWSRRARCRRGLRHQAASRVEWWLAGCPVGCEAPADPWKTWERFSETFRPGALRDTARLVSPQGPRAEGCGIRDGGHPHRYHVRALRVRLRGLTVTPEPRGA